MYSIDGWTTHCLSTLESNFGVDATEAFAFKQRMDGFKIKDLKKDSVDKYFSKVTSKRSNIPITTVHQVKGSTLDAILCFFDSTGSKESITFKDFNKTTTFPSEKQRIIYVACSRPQHLLAMAFPEKITDKEILQRFGPDVFIHNFPILEADD